MFWIINDNIKFYPEQNKLVSVTNPELSAILTSPASRCLSLLLESYPEVVTQKTFFTSVWAEDGMLVPANTLYQNISIVRRGLKTTGETDETLISTVPRKGFQISSSVTVVRVDAQEEAQQAPDTSAIEAEPAGSAADIPSFEPVTMPGSVRAGRRYPRFIPLLMMLLSLGLGLSLFQLPWHRTADKDFFTGYTITRVENGCHFFSRNDDIKKFGNFTKYRNMILQTGLDCKKYPWVYFLSSSSAPALSAFICPEPYEKPSNSGCITLYFRWSTR